MKSDASAWKTPAFEGGAASLLAAGTVLDADLRGLFPGGPAVDLRRRGCIRLPSRRQGETPVGEDVARGTDVADHDESPGEDSASLLDRRPGSRPDRCRGERG